MSNSPVPDTGGVQGGHPEHRPQRGHLPRGPQQHGRSGPADVQRLCLRHHRADNLSGLLQIRQHKVILNQFLAKIISVLYLGVTSIGLPNHVDHSMKLSMPSRKDFHTGQPKLLAKKIMTDNLKFGSLVDFIREPWWRNIILNQSQPIFIVYRYRQIDGAFSQLSFVFRLKEPVHGIKPVKN